MTAVTIVTLAIVLICDLVLKKLPPNGRFGRFISKEYCRTTAKEKSRRFLSDTATKGGNAVSFYITRSLLCALCYHLCALVKRCQYPYSRPFSLRFCTPITITNHQTLKNQNPGKGEEYPQAFAGAEKRIDFLSEIIYNVNDVLIIRKNIGMRDMRNLT